VHGAPIKMPYKTVYFSNGSTDLSETLRHYKCELTQHILHIFLNSLGLHGLKDTAV